MPLLQRVNGMSFQVADAWFTGCIYARIPPTELSSVSGTDVVVQGLQMMPYGAVARSLEARLQRLLLLSTADNTLLLMEWSEGHTAVRTGSGNLVLLDQVRLPFHVLQFLRQEPEVETRSAPSADAGKVHGARLLRTFPWEADSLLRRTPADEPRRSDTTSASGCTDSDSSTTGGSSDACDSDGLGMQPPQRVRLEGGRNSQDASLIRDFPSYGLGLVDQNSGRILRSLDQQTLQGQMQKKTDMQGQLLAVTPLPSHPGVLASIVRKVSPSQQHCPPTLWLAEVELIQVH